MKRAFRALAALWLMVCGCLVTASPVFARSETRAVTYTYDTLHRLTSESVTAVSAVNNTPGGVTQWTHDAVSNRLTQTSSIPGIPNQAFSYDLNDRLTTDTYDANGNTLQGSVQESVPAVSSGNAPITGTDTYDSYDRLTLRQSPDGSLVQVKYNGDGHRVEHHVFRPAAGSAPASYTITRYLVDDLNPTGYAQVIEESTITSPSGAPNAPPVLNAVYTYGHDLISQDRAPAPGAAWQLSYYLYDGHGNVRALADAAGEITDRYDYDAWGQILHTSGATANPYLYTGEQYDPTLGLYHLRARMMNPLTGRFWNMDTYEGNGADPASLHKYLYANADPVQHLDPSGYMSLAGELVALGNASVLRGLATIRIGFSVSRAAGGNALRLLGKAVENEVQKILVSAGAFVAPGQVVFGPGGRRVIDFLVQMRDRLALIEVKFQIPPNAGPALTRLISQLQSSVSDFSSRGQVVLFTFRDPNTAQMERLYQQLGPDIANEVQFVSGFSGLVQWMSFYFR